MIDQSKLLECMEEIKAIAVAQQGKLTKGEVEQYLNGMDLSTQQMNAVYQYLGASQIEVEGYDYVPEVDPEEIHSEEAKAKSETEERDHAGRIVKDTAEVQKELTKAEINLQIYRQELAELEARTDDKEVMLFQRYLQGETSLRNQLIEGRLQHVHDLAADYSKRKVSEDEVIAEGNMGLMIAMSVLENDSASFLQKDGTPEMHKILSVIETEVRQSIENMIDDMTSGKDWEDTILAKANLLHEAAKYLAEDMGREATQEELAEYTKISLEEIRDIQGLAEK